MRAPVLQWVPGYRRAWLGPDLLAGLVLAAILVPQGMAYAEVAGLPPVNGLYATVVPLLVFAFLGASRNLVLGPDSSTAALVGATLAPLAVAGSERYVALAGGLALVSGMLFLIARVARLGFLSDFLGGPIITGYQAGLGVTIVVRQLPKLLGFSVDADGTVRAAVDTLRNLDQTVWISAVVGGLTLVAILVLGRWAPQLPGILIVVVAATVLSSLLHLEDHGLTLLGTLPSGFPPLGLPDLERGDLRSLVAGGLGIFLVSFTDTVVESRVAADRGGFDPDIEGDMIGVGAADLAAGVASGFPVSSSGSRTVVVQSAGGRSQLANMAAGVVLLFVLVVATGPLAYIPNAVLAGVVMSAGLRLISVKAFRRLWNERRTEFLIAVSTALAVVIVGILPGIGFAVVLALLNFVRRSARPFTALLGEVNGIGYHTQERFPEARSRPGVLVYRFDAPLFFANASWFADQVRHHVRHAEEPVRWFVVDAAGITDVDTTAAAVLADLVSELAGAGVTFTVADPPGRVIDELQRYGVTELLGADHIYNTVTEAVDACPRKE